VYSANIDFSFLQSLKVKVIELLNLLEITYFYYKKSIVLLTLKETTDIKVMQSTSKENTAINEMLFRLERNHTEIQMLLGKLNSYTCEPTDYECFMRLRDLRDEIAALKQRHLQLFSDLEQRHLDNERGLIVKMQNQLSSFKELDKKIGAYLIDTSSY